MLFLVEDCFKFHKLIFFPTFWVTIVGLLAAVKLLGTFFYYTVYYLSPLVLGIYWLTLV